MACGAQGCCAAIFKNRFQIGLCQILDSGAKPAVLDRRSDGVKRAEVWNHA